jgi:hypothetical protein
VAGAEGSDTGLSPTEFVAVTVNVYVDPATSVKLREVALPPVVATTVLPSAVRVATTR